MQEIVYQEEPDYPFHSFISDIGGATGVILGISFATVFGAIDFAFAHFIGNIKSININFFLKTSKIRKKSKYL